jgi:hypothetical protein
MEWWKDQTEPEDFDPWEDCINAKGKWITECRANRYHDCVRRSPYCPGEICPGEVYKREAILEKPLGMDKRGTVTVYRYCQECMPNAQT